MHRGGGCADVSPNTSSLLALKPRQVLLVELRRDLAMERKLSAQLKPEQESVLICSIAHWLENKGLTKVLKRFISATQIQDDDWKARALNLSEIFSNYLDSRNDTIKDNTKTQLDERGVTSAEQIGGACCAVSEGIVREKKKKKKGDVPAINSERTSEDAAIKEKANESDLKLQCEKNCKTNGEQNSRTFNESTLERVCELTPELGDESVKKQKDKKKKRKSEATITDEKLLNAIPEMTKEKQKDLLSVASNDKHDSEVIVETKDKKKKKKMKTDDLIADNTSGVEALDSEKPIDAFKKESVEAAGVVVKESKKSSKKRKGLASDENEELPILNETVREAKRRKPDGHGTQITLPNGHADSHNKEENFQVAGEKQIGETLDVDADIGGDKLSQAKSAKKEQDSYAEPKTVNAFQRVKIDEVDYVDERLQDNSYWAKGGAESGYGAKAQEILGQVKGSWCAHLFVLSVDKRPFALHGTPNGTISVSLDGIKMQVASSVKNYLTVYELLHTKYGTGSLVGVPVPSLMLVMERKGFRHEKTKKKRGSYRGGQIDLQSHSIKFNYADED
ncbi:hypothetical protein F511_06637 [Dorcoceras hygrometricum]|uniref:Srp40 C-terminal domain-containing protein n=1 Tax=Dorcoceras hygrometricum TaxID=472368 RepID=A0A2Z7B0L5_9LAMI|nr:hypothetical protein F511_06637 [Dorcoceras hygrometricum]